MKQRPPTRASWTETLKANAERANAERSASPRNLALVILDIVAGLVLLFVTLAIAIGAAGSATQYSTLHEACTPELVDGLRCNGTVLGIVTVALMAVAILGFVIAVGMVLVNLLRRRWTFWWPLGASVVITGIYWLGTWIVSLTLPPGLTS
jgi:hypothetical protein